METLLGQLRSLAGWLKGRSGRTWSQRLENRNGEWQTDRHWNSKEIMHMRYYCNCIWKSFHWRVSKCWVYSKVIYFGRLFFDGWMIDWLIDWLIVRLFLSCDLRLTFSLETPLPSNVHLNLRPIFTHCTALHFPSPATAPCSPRHVVIVVLKQTWLNKYLSSYSLGRYILHNPTIRHQHFRT